MTKTEKETRPPLFTRFWGRLGVKTNNKTITEIAYNHWQKQLLKKQKELEEKSKKTKEEAIKVLKEFEKGYILEDEQGTLTEERIQELTHEELLEAIETYMQELKRDVGDVTK